MCWDGDCLPHVGFLRKGCWSCVLNHGLCLGCFPCFPCPRGKSTYLRHRKNESLILEVVFRVRTGRPWVVGDEPLLTLSHLPLRLGSALTPRLAHLICPLKSHRFFVSISHVPSPPGLPGSPLWRLNLSVFSDPQHFILL